jgi:hypothetical protein
LSAEEAFRLLQSKHDREHQTAWSRFETELARRTAEIREQHKDELRLTLSEKDSLSRRVEDSLRKIAELRECASTEWCPRGRRAFQKPIWYSEASF